MRVVVFLIVCLLLSGCLSARGPKAESTCHIGPSGIFMKFRQYGAYTTPDNAVQDYFVDRGGQLYFFRGGYDNENGTGKIDTSNARLHNLAAEDVKTQMQRAGFYQPTKDFNLSVAYRVAIKEPDFLLICDQAGSAAFYRLNNVYDDPNVADCGWTEINVNTQRGDKTVRAWCEAGPDEFDDLKETFLQVAQRTKGAANIPD